MMMSHVTMMDHVMTLDVFHLWLSVMATHNATMPRMKVPTYAVSIDKYW